MHFNTDGQATEICQELNGNTSLQMACEKQALLTDDSCVSDNGFDTNIWPNNVSRASYKLKWDAI